METHSVETTVVVMETGSAWPAWIEQSLRAANTRVIVQQEEETPADLADRVIDRVESLTVRGFKIAVAVLACGERADDSASDARRQIARSLLSAFAAAGEPGRVLFTASQRSSGAMRSTLSGLATDLQAEWESTGSTLSVRFGTGARKPQELVSRVA